MSALEQYQATRPNSWEQIWDLDYAADEVIPGRFTPIPPIEIPFLLQERLLVVAISSQSAKPHWTFGGTLIQQHLLPDISSQPIDGHSVICRLNSIKLELMNDFTADYRLLYQVPKWIRDISISIWRYTGPVDSPILNQLGEIETEINQNQTRIDNFRDYVSNKLSSHTTKLNANKTAINQVKGDTEQILLNQS